MRHFYDMELHDITLFRGNFSLSTILLWTIFSRSTTLLWMNLFEPENAQTRRKHEKKTKKTRKKDEENTKETRNFAYFSSAEGENQRAKTAR